MSAVTTIKSREEFGECCAKNGRVALFAAAAWARPSKTIAPEYERLAGEYKDKIVFLEFDVDEVRDLAIEFSLLNGVVPLPAFYFFAHGVSTEDLNFMGAYSDNLQRSVRKLADLELVEVEPEPAD